MVRLVGPWMSKQNLSVLVPPLEVVAETIDRYDGPRDAPCTRLGSERRIENTQDAGQCGAIAEGSTAQAET